MNVVRTFVTERDEGSFMGVVVAVTVKGVEDVNVSGQRKEEVM
jgi:hypothetical protein